MTELLTSPLHAEHEKLGATFTAFGPWNMPLKYQNELDEHRAVLIQLVLVLQGHVPRTEGRESGAEFFVLGMKRGGE